MVSSGPSLSLLYGWSLSVNINDMHIIILREQTRIACTLLLNRK